MTHKHHAERVEKADVLSGRTDGAVEARPETQAAQDAGVASQTPPVDAIAKAREEADAARQQLAAVEDKYLRVLAEFDNYKRRTSREYDRLVESANAALMQDLVGVREDFERALKAGLDSADAGAVQDGMRLIFTRFDGVLSKHGLEPYAVDGDAFDPIYHDAMLRMPHESIAEDHLAQVVERGYRLKGQVIKHARVIVSAGAPSAAAHTENDGSAADAQAPTEGEKNG